jgi:radical SAM-linked protein
MVRLWHRALRRAGLEPAYSGGFNPHPRIQLAAPLPLGVTGGSELMDVVVASPVAPGVVLSRLNAQLPPGISVLQVLPVPFELPSLQSQVRRAQYRVEVPLEDANPVPEDAVRQFLGLESLPWSHQRDQKVRRYDLRSLVADLWVEEKKSSSVIIGMLLKCDNSGSGRPEQVIKALGLSEPESIHRTGLVLSSAMENEQ